ncbi:MULTISPECIES: hypothetical protein [Sphingomonas]|uniref:hypothetical protein n=1 Tax=Sphingomonas TaxID=13687 RepID=UPI000DEEE46F|nr:MULTISPECIES: hypothetical protein [Sphingomonas]
MSDGPEWFEPKRVGFGAGLPIAWQGWAVLGVYFALVGVALRYFDDDKLTGAAIVLPATAALIFVASRTTRGGWRWRRGDDD